MAEVRTKASEMRKQAKKPAKAAKGNGPPRVPRPPSAPKPPPTPTDDDEDEDEEPAKDAIVIEGEDITQWPTRAEAARKVGVTKSTIIRWQKEGDLEAYPDADGVFHFNPADLEELATARGNEASAIMGQTVSMVVRSAQELTKGSQDFANKFGDRQLDMSGLAFDQVRQMAELLQQENKDLRTYVRELEGDRREAMKENEAAKGKVHEREIEKLKVETSEKRTDWAIGALISLAGPSIAKKLGLDMGVVGAFPMSNGSPAAPQIGGGPAHSQPQTEVQKNGVSTEGVNGTGAIGIGNPATEGDLLRLETNCIMLIGGIEKDRMDMLCRFSKPNEAEALMQIWTTVNNLKKKAAEQKPAEEAKA